MDGLSFKQAAATFAIALALGLATSAWDLWTDYQGMRAQVRAEAERNLVLVRSLAVEAAYQLSSELAQEVASGLSQDHAVRSVRLADNFGHVLATVEREPARTSFPNLARDMFGDITERAETLETKGGDGQPTPVGHLEMSLDPGHLLSDYLGRVMVTAVSGAARAAALCALVVAVFYVMITKPLLRISQAVAKVDPARPGAFLLERPRNHERDELGLVVGSINAMLSGFQEGLDGRDKAESALAALARDLEARVEQRTAELAREKGQLAKANRSISDSIRYAARIQSALLPDRAALAGLVDEVAVGWQPLDMVGGDYYWMGSVQGRAVLAVADCTGHGVPGAFMSAVVASALARVLNHHEGADPGRVLAELNRLVKLALRQEYGRQDLAGDDGLANDGLDAAVCILDPDRATLRFAGANQPLLVASGGKLSLVKGDRRSLGYRETPLDATFTTHELPVAAGDTFYLYTDGVTDQVAQGQRRLYGRKRLEEMLARVAHRPLEDQMAAVFAALDDWRAGEPRRDDLTFVAFRPKAG